MAKCINNTKNCIDSSLNEFFECAYCDAQFYNKMMTLRKLETPSQKEAKNYLTNIPVEYIEDILIDSTNLYKVKYKTQKELAKFLSRKYEVKLTAFLVKQLASDSNLRKYGLKWKYKEE